MSSPHPRAGFAWPQRQTLLLSLALFLATLALYYPVHHYPFIDIDDNFYVTENPHVLGALNLSTVKWAFTHPFVLNYDPLTFFSHSLDVQMFGLDAGRHHDVNVILHALDAVLLFWVLKRATGYTLRSFMVAALFALHPINVENVAWISERKTMLSTLFFFLALGAYRWYAREPRLRRMAVVAFLYGLGLLAKPQVITLPFVLLLWDYWPLRRMFATAPDSSTAAVSEVIPPRSFAALIKEKIPLFAIAVVDVMLTLVAQHVAGSSQSWPYTLTVRLENAIVAYARIPGKGAVADRSGARVPLSRELPAMVAGIRSVAAPVDDQCAGRCKAASPLSRGGVALVPGNPGSHDRFGGATGFGGPGGPLCLCVLRGVCS